MSDLRSLALLNEFLKDKLRKADSNDPLSDKDLAAAYNAAQTSDRRRIGFTLDRIGEIRRGNWPRSDDELLLVLQICQKLLKTCQPKLDAAKPLPPWLEESYSPQLTFNPLIAAAPAHSSGDQLGDLSQFVPGLWQFSYYSPVDRHGQKSPEVRTTAAIFHDAAAQQRSFDVSVISGNGLWRGVAFLNDHHMYLRVSEPDKNETAFFIVNRPEKSAQKIVGIGAALERVTKPGVRSVAACVCFGERLTMANDKPLQAAVEKSLSGAPLTRRQHNLIHDRVCSTKSLEKFRTDHPGLYNYTSGVQINEQRGLYEGGWLYLAY